MKRTDAGGIPPTAGLGRAFRYVGPAGTGASRPVEVTSNIRQIASEVLLGDNEGLLKPCVANCDNSSAGMLAPERWVEVKQAIGAALVEPKKHHGVAELRLAACPDAARARLICRLFFPHRRADCRLVCPKYVKLNSGSHS